MRLKPRVLVLWSVVVSGAMLLFVCAASLFLPDYVEVRLKEAAKALGVDLSCDVRRIGLTGLDVVSLRVGDAVEPGLVLDSLRLDYTLSGLLEKRIDRIAVSGLAIYVEEVDGVTSLRGIDVESLRTSGVDDSGDTSGAPLSFGSCEIRNSFLSLVKGRESKRFPFEVELGSFDGSGELSISRIALSGPLHATLQAPDDEFAILRFGDTGISFRNRMRLGIDQQIFRDLPVDTTNECVVGLDIDASWVKGEEWSFEIQARSVDERVVFGGEGIGRMGCRPGVLTLGGKGRSSAGSVDISFELADVLLESENAVLALPRLVLEARAGFGEAKTLNGRGELRLEGAVLDAGKFRAEGLSAIIPIRWPMDESSNGIGIETALVGAVSVDAMYSEEVSLGSLAVDLTQQGPGYAFTGIHLGLAGEREVGLSGTVGFEDDQFARLCYSLSVAETNVVVQFGDFLPNNDAFLDGDIRLGYHGSIPQGDERDGLTLGLSSTSLDIPSLNMVVEGVDLQLTFEDTVGFSSLPGQNLTFSRFAMGDVETGGGKLVFCIESTDSILIERSRVAWCGGHVGTDAMRISPASSDMNLVLRCDGLELARILSQFKVLDAEGEGTVNGRLPVRYDDGKVFINDGFLYSTPGETGRLKVKDSAGMLGSVDGAVQVDIAREALKDFRYDWSRLAFDSDDDLLVIALRMKGKPSSLLPFQHSSKRGLMKALDGKKKAHFQGIEFEINFNVPLNELLQYGKRMDALLHR